MASVCASAGPTTSCEVKRRPAPVDMAPKASARATSSALDAKEPFTDLSPYALLIPCQQQQQKTRKQKIAGRQGYNVNAATQRATHPPDN